MRHRIPSLAASLALAGVSVILAGSRPSAESVLAGEPPEVTEVLMSEKIAVVQDGGGDGPESFVVAYVLFQRSPDAVRALMRQASRQPEYRPELKSVKTVEHLDHGRVDEQRMRIMFKELVYRLRYSEDPDTGRLEWQLDPSFDNDLRRLEGFWELYAFEAGADRTLGRFGSQVDVGRGVPKFVQRGMSRKSVLRYVRNSRAWIDSDGEWRP